MGRLAKELARLCESMEQHSTANEPVFYIRCILYSWGVLCV